jgi:hypothetical protein
MLVGNIWRLFDGHKDSFVRDVELVSIGWAAVAAEFVLVVDTKLR